MAIEPNDMSRIVFVIAVLTLAWAAGAQDVPESRSGALAALQAKKSLEAKPPEPDRVEALVRRVEKTFLESPSGFYPFFSSVYHGGGLTLGAGYRQFYGDNTAWNV